MIWRKGWISYDNKNLCLRDSSHYFVLFAAKLWFLSQDSADEDMRTFGLINWYIQKYKLKQIKFKHWKWLLIPFNGWSIIGLLPLGYMQFHLLVFKLSLSVDQYFNLNFLGWGAFLLNNKAHVHTNYAAIRYIYFQRVGFDYGQCLSFKSLP